MARVSYFSLPLSSFLCHSHLLGPPLSRMPLSWPEAEGLQCDHPQSLWCALQRVEPLVTACWQCMGIHGCQALKLTLESFKSCRTSIELVLAPSFLAFLDLSAEGDSVLFSYILKALSAAVVAGKEMREKRGKECRSWIPLTSLNTWMFGMF